MEWHLQDAKAEYRHVRKNYFQQDDDICDNLHTFSDMISLKTRVSATLVLSVNPSLSAA